ncbi:hypothetical protein HY500_03205 [Candidatus Woesearchaeota archaeon]|nr:hypothetical protein [Candidatus Woesearchaeota archaeon]
MSFLNKIFHRKEEYDEQESSETNFNEEHDIPDFNLNREMLEPNPNFQQPKGSDDLLMSRLETINVKLDNIIHRLEKLERIAEKESGPERW